MDEIVELLEYLNQKRPGWSKSLSQLENVDDTQGALPPLE